MCPSLEADWRDFRAEAQRGICLEDQDYGVPGMHGTIGSGAASNGARLITGLSPMM